MSSLFQGAMRSCEDYFTAFDERASETKGEQRPEREGGDASCAFCFAALLAALGYVLAAASASSAAPF